MPKRLKIETGDKYGRLTIVREVSAVKSKRIFICKCECSKKITISLNKIRSGHTKSCGCWRRNPESKANYTKDETHKRLYRIWSQMKRRCSIKSGREYKYYGIRGIKVCDAWLDFSEFKKWALSNGYEGNLTIERIDFNGNYEPSNCTWITQGEQTKNSRHNHFVILDGEKMCVRDALRKVSMDPATFYKRIKTMSDQEALKMPVKKYKYNGS